MSRESSDLPQGWVLTTVGRVGSIRLGKPRSPEQLTGRYSTKYLRAANITPRGALDLSTVHEMDFTPEERAILQLKAGDVLVVSSSGSALRVGRAALWSDEVPGACYQNHLIRFRPHACLPKFALLVFRQYVSSGEVARVARGVGIQHLGASRFAEMPFPLPPIAEQQRIVTEAYRRLAQMSEAEAALQRALARTYEQDAMILAAACKGELLETEVVLARREKRHFIDAETALAAGTTAPLLFHDTAPQPGSGLSWSIPPGWSATRVEVVGEVRLGRQRSPQYQLGKHPTPYLRAGNITHEGLDLSRVHEMDFTPEERKKYSLQVGDVVLAEASGSASQVGRPAVWNGDVRNCCFQNTVLRFRPRLVRVQFALIVFKHYAESGEFAAVARGIGLQHLGALRFAKMAFPLPPEKEQERIEQATESRLHDSSKLRSAVTQSLNRFAPMRSELLTLAVQGQLVGQDAMDESAQRLLERVGEPLPEILPMDNYKTEPIEVTDEAQSIGSSRQLVAVLGKAGRTLTVPELFAMAGYDRDSPEQVEMFYLAIRSEIGKTIRVVDDQRENVGLEAVEDED